MTWLTIFGMACITYLNRFAFFSAKMRYKPGDKLKRFLSFSSLAVLTAIWAPIVFRIDLFGTSVVQPDTSLTAAISSVAPVFSIVGWDYLIATVAAIVMSMARFHSLLVVLISTSLFFLLRVCFFS